MPGNFNNTNNRRLFTVSEDSSLPSSCDELCKNFLHMRCYTVCERVQGEGLWKLEFFKQKVTLTKLK